MVFIFFFYLRIKIFDLGKDFWKKCLFVKRLMVWEILNFYKGGGVKGVSGVIFILKNFMYLCFFLLMLFILLYKIVLFIFWFIFKCIIFFIIVVMYKNK